LRTSAGQVALRVRAIDPAHLEEGRYESGWNGRQVLAHMASIVEIRAKTIAAVEAADPAVLSRRVITAGGRMGTIAQVLHDVAVSHVPGRLRDLSGEQ